jgi:hypothetical protein
MRYLICYDARWINELASASPTPPFDSAQGRLFAKDAKDGALAHQWIFLSSLRDFFQRPSKPPSAEALG